MKVKTVKNTGHNMQNFKKILLFARENIPEETTLKRASILAGRNRAQLTVLKVIGKLPSEMRHLASSTHPLDLEKLVIEEHNKQLEHLIAPIRDEGVRVAAQVIFGTPFLEVIKEVLLNGHDLVIKTASGGNGLMNMLFGSTAMHLLRKCPCPVWVIEPTHLEKYARIMAAVDLDTSEEEKNTLNNKIMELSTSMVGLEGSELHAIYVCPSYNNSILKRSLGLSKSEVNGWAHDNQMKYKVRLTKLLGKYAPEIPENRVHLPQGRPDKLIPSLAKEKGIDLIVMGTVCRTGISGLFIGSTAEKVLHQVDCSVLAVKPDGFVTPVKL